jgi:hypothetical protein
MGTKHKADCSMVFGRKDPTCPRCQELLAGSAPRPRFGGRCLTMAAKPSRFEPHDCRERGCGPVCTFGDW